MSHQAIEKETVMTPNNTGFLGTFRQYAGKLKTMRDEARTAFAEFSARRPAQGYRLARPLSARRRRSL